MKFLKSMLLVIVLGLFNQSVYGAFSEDVPPPVIFPPEVEPEEVPTLSANMVIKTWGNSQPAKVNIKSRGVLRVVLEIEDEIDEELLGDATLSAEVGTDVSPVWVRKRDVNGDGVRDLVFYFKTRDVFDGEFEADTDVTLTLSLSFDDELFDFSTDVRTAAPKRWGWLKKLRRRK